MAKLLTAVAATASALAASVVVGTPAAAAAASCTVPLVTATHVTQHAAGTQFDFVDVATASASCVDLVPTPHTAQLVFEWYYDPGTGFSPMPACPSTVVSPPVAWTSAVTVTGAATCQRPVSSGAWERPRMVCVDLLVDGTRHFAGPVCVNVLLNPTPV